MNLEDIEARLKTIENAECENIEESLLYNLRYDVLLAIANGAENPSELAAKALTPILKEWW
jgi:leucyl aminopeptidase